MQNVYELYIYTFRGFWPVISCNGYDTDVFWVPALPKAKQRMTRTDTIKERPASTQILKRQWWDIYRLYAFHKRNFLLLLLAASIPNHARPDCARYFKIEKRKFASEWKILTFIFLKAQKARRNFVWKFKYYHNPVRILIINL